MSELPPKPKKKRNLTRVELQEFSKEELIDKIIELEAYNTQLKNILSKKSEGGTENTSDKEKKVPTRKQFDFNKAHNRKILLHITYLGWNYHGLAVQEDSEQTIEHHLFKALTKTCIVESREKAEYHRCGRTDKGVSAFGQVISLKVRSKFPPELQNSEESLSNEMEYCKMLNRVLPKDIRAIRWIPVPKEKPDFSARFDCKKRTYKYYFPKSNLNIPLMKESAAILIGSHDFRNLCKMDVGNGVTEFTRHILMADILAFDSNDLDRPTSMYYLLIQGNAFLWHQIRCIMSVLLLIGSGKETKDVVNQLLDFETNNKKPQYSMAIDIPLNLFECSYDLNDRWVYNELDLKNTITELQQEWTIHNVKTTMIRDCLKTLESMYAELILNTKGDGTISNESEIVAYDECLIQGVRAKNYVPLMKRGTCSSLEEKIKYYKKKRLF